MNKQLVIGCGTGRCGTSTLAALLNMQPHSHVTHERFSHSLPWNHTQQGLWLAQQLAASCHDHSSPGLVGDVALQWGNYAPQWLAEGAKVVVMKRDIESWMESWRKKSGRRNNWQPPEEGGTPGRSKWYHCFPKVYGASSKEEALRRYYAHYYGAILDAMAPWRDQVLVMHVVGFNTEEGQRRLLDFLGVEREHQVIQVGIKRNAARVKP